mmetsp:Transcript_21950/g.30854  ORF Transcript_21950/g.30854 Transcript_21950/m.30854 type:complete len:159 (-) Transcript_21950:61-537(-)
MVMKACQKFLQSTNRKVAPLKNRGNIFRQKNFFIPNKLCTNSGRQIIREAFYLNPKERQKYIIVKAKEDQCAKPSAKMNKANIHINHDDHVWVEKLVVHKKSKEIASIYVCYCKRNWVEIKEMTNMFEPKSGANIVFRLKESYRTRAILDLKKKSCCN